MLISSSFSSPSRLRSCLPRKLGAGTAPAAPGLAPARAPATPPYRPGRRAAPGPVRVTAARRGPLPLRPQDPAANPLSPPASEVTTDLALVYAPCCLCWLRAVDGAWWLGWRCFGRGTRLVRPNVRHTAIAARHVRRAVGDEAVAALASGG